jgi:hypothetical protein
VRLGSDLRSARAVFAGLVGPQLVVYLVARGDRVNDSCTASRVLLVAHREYVPDPRCCRGSVRFLADEIEGKGARSRGSQAWPSAQGVYTLVAELI